MFQLLGLPSAAEVSRTADGWLSRASGISTSNEPASENPETADHTPRKNGPNAAPPGGKEADDTQAPPEARSTSPHAAAGPPSPRKSKKGNQRETTEPRKRPGRSQLSRHLSLQVDGAAAGPLDVGALRIAPADQRFAPGNRPANLALRAEYAPGAVIEPKAAGWSLHGFLVGAAQATEDPSDIERVGIGGHWRFARRGQLSGEVSADNGRLSLQATGSDQIDNRFRLYSNLGLSSQGADALSAGLGGSLTGGARLLASDRNALFAEERVRFADPLIGLTHVFGADLKPGPAWTWRMNLEMGDSGDTRSGACRYRGGMASAGYARKDIRYGSHLEWRMNAEGGPPEGAAWQTRNDFSFRIRNDWNLRGSLDISFYPGAPDSASMPASMGCLLELARETCGRDLFSMRMKYAFPPTERDWSSGLEGIIQAAISPAMQMNLGYQVRHSPDRGAGSLPDERCWFMELAAAF
jgi:hypothetical protein